MMTGIIFLLFFACLGILTPLAVIVNWRSMNRWERLFFTLGAIASELAMAFVLVFMHTVAHDGIFRWSFWLN